MSAERELEQLRASFAVERSALENDLAKTRRACSLLAERYSEVGREVEAAKDEASRLRRQLDEACKGEKEPPAPRPPILRCSQCDSQVGPSHWARDGERRCEKCGPFEPRATGRCDVCGTSKPVADDECSWCGPGAHSP